MAKEIPGVVAYPFDAQSNAFFCALASALLPALGYTEETPYFCKEKESECVQCGNCSGKSTLQKYHLNLYHDYQTFTGVSLGWDWPENDSPYQVIPGWKDGWRWPDEFFNFIFGHAGLSWKRLSKRSDEQEVRAALIASIDAGFPALLRLGMEWRVVTGYHGETLFGLKYRVKEPIAFPDWFATFEDAVIITGRTERTVTFRDVLGRMISALEHPAHAALEKDVAERIDAISPANALETACWLGEIVGFPPEARWHAADSSLRFMTNNQDIRRKLFGMTRQYVFDHELNATHGISNTLCGMLTLGHAKGYAVSPAAADLIQQENTRHVLKRLLSIVFENDRVVFNLLRGAAEMIERMKETEY